MQSLISVDFKVVFTCSGKPIGAQPHLSAVWLMFPLSQFQFCSDWWWPFLSLSNYAKSDEEKFITLIILVVFRALAASAPIWQFQGLTACGSFYEIVERTFRTGSSYCVDNIARSWSTIMDFWRESASCAAMGFVCVCHRCKSVVCVCVCAQSMLLLLFSGHFASLRTLRFLLCVEVISAWNAHNHKHFWKVLHVWCWNWNWEHIANYCSIRLINGVNNNNNNNKTKVAKCLEELWSLFQLLNIAYQSLSYTEAEYCSDLPSFTGEFMWTRT